MGPEADRKDHKLLTAMTATGALWADALGAGLGAAWGYWFGYGRAKPASATSEAEAPALGPTLRMTKYILAFVSSLTIAYFTFLAIFHWIEPSLAQKWFAFSRPLTDTVAAVVPAIEAAESELNKLGFPYRPDRIELVRHAIAAGRILISPILLWAPIAFLDPRQLFARHHKGAKPLKGVWAGYLSAIGAFSLFIVFLFWLSPISDGMKGLQGSNLDVFLMGPMFLGLAVSYVVVIGVGAALIESFAIRVRNMTATDKS